MCERNLAREIMYPLDTFISVGHKNNNLSKKRAMCRWYQPVRWYSILFSLHSDYSTLVLLHVDSLSWLRLICSGIVNFNRCVSVPDTKSNLFVSPNTYSPHIQREKSYELGTS